MNSDRKRNTIYFTLTSVFLVASTLIFLDAVRFHPTDAQCVQRMFAWSPAKGIIEYQWTMFPEFGFLVHSKWFDAALPEREAAWEEFLPRSPISVPISHIDRLNLAPDADWIRSPVKADNILALPEVFVQLECLNLLRLHAQKDETDNGHLPSFRGSEDDVYQRVEQCFDRLRTSVLCWSDIVPVLQEYADDDLHTHVVKYDFATKHKCRNFAGIRDWTLKNGVQNVEMNNAWWGGFAGV
ncbi:hypothetical protein BDV41DRAFT_572563 [Aspergillus transmontanensis]|uniref:Uncharacterized protein n=1 Tax=Aspergillus transmontanensis TaxID=1034304 RepID=A0A5N6W9Z6_9EURO|nr:hypothetical protein BDV41DRAFT_572563 [Aspergillus transmontanensis]